MIGPVAKRLPVAFYETERGAAPVRDWLLSLPSDDRRAIGSDIKTVEFGWPIGMPLCRAIAGRKGLWEVRSNLTGGRIARVLFCIRDGRMALLHGFEKTTQKTPDREIEVAIRRMKGLER
jgi:phage-related protein